VPKQIRAATKFVVLVSPVKNPIWPCKELKDATLSVDGGLLNQKRVGNFQLKLNQWVTETEFGIPETVVQFLEEKYLMARISIKEILTDPNLKADMGRDYKELVFNVIAHAAGVIGKKAYMQAMTELKPKRAHANKIEKFLASVEALALGQAVQDVLRFGTDAKDALAQANKDRNARLEAVDLSASLNLLKNEKAFEKSHVSAKLERLRAGSAKTPIKVEAASSGREARGGRTVSAARSNGRGSVDPEPEPEPDEDNEPPRRRGQEEPVRGRRAAQEPAPRARRQAPIEDPLDDGLEETPAPRARRQPAAENVEETGARTPRTRREHVVDEEPLEPRTRRASRELEPDDLEIEDAPAEPVRRSRGAEKTPAPRRSESSRSRHEEPDELSEIDDPEERGGTLDGNGDFESEGQKGDVVQYTKKQLSGMGKEDLIEHILECYDFMSETAGPSVEDGATADELEEGMSPDSLEMGEEFQDNPEEIDEPTPSPRRASRHAEPEAASRRSRNQPAEEPEDDFGSVGDDDGFGELERKPQRSSRESARSTHHDLDLD